MEPPPRSDNAETILDGRAAGTYPAPPPERIGAYRVEGRLGLGGMGEVLLAWDERLERWVAIKRIRQDAGLPPDQRERFRREARLAARLSHSAVVQIYDLVSEGTEDAIVMEYVEGRTLADRLLDERLETAEVLRLAGEIAEGLAAAHEAGLIHRDLKASNVLVTPAGHAKILDFGLARLKNQAQGDLGLTRQGMILGTFHAMSPEQARGEELDERSDLFSFGSLVHEMLTGNPPFRGKDAVDSLRRVVTEEPADPRLARPDLPPALAHLLRRLLAKDRDDRPAHAREVIEVLASLPAAPSGPHPAAPARRPGSFFASGAVTRLLRRAPLRRRAPGVRSRRLLLAGAVLVLLVAAGALFLAVRPNVRTEDYAAWRDVQTRVDGGVVRREDLERLEKIIGTSPRFLEARVLAARIAHNLFLAEREPADLQHEAELVEQAMRQFPDHPLLLQQAAWIALARNDVERARSTLAKLERLAPEDPDVLPLRARLAERQGRTNEAESLLKEAVEKAPSWQNRYRLADFAAQHRHLGEARAQLGEILRTDPENLWALERSASLELSDGDLNEAERLYRQLLHFNKERAINNLATVLQLRGRSQEAASFYQLVLDTQPDHPTAMFNLAEVETDLGHRRRAEELYRKALTRLEILEGEAGLEIAEVMLKAQCLARLGQTRKAVEIAEAQIRKSPDDPHLLLQSALIHSLNGDRAAALADARKACAKGARRRWLAGQSFRWLLESPELRSCWQPEP